MFIESARAVNPIFTDFWIDRAWNIYRSPSDKHARLRSKDFLDLGKYCRSLAPDFIIAE